jgi:signal transduction histidine kinase
VSAKKGIFTGSDDQILKSELKEVQHYIRNLSHKLAIPPSHHLDLPRLIEEQKYWVGNEKVNFVFNFDPQIDWKKVPEHHQNEMYRIVQESVSNAFKHAKADKIAISIKDISKKICVEVADNGTGIMHKNGNGIGINNMLERAKTIGAEFQIYSGKEEGTTTILTYSLS